MSTAATSQQMDKRWYYEKKHLDHCSNGFDDRVFGFEFMGVYLPGYAYLLRKARRCRCAKALPSLLCAGPCGRSAGSGRICARTGSRSSAGTGRICTGALGAGRQRLPAGSFHSYSVRYE